MPEIESTDNLAVVSAQKGSKSPVQDIMETNELFFANEVNTTVEDTNYVEMPEFNVAENAEKIEVKPNCDNVLGNNLLTEMKVEEKQKTTKSVLEEEQEDDDLIDCFLS